MIKNTIRFPDNYEATVALQGISNVLSQLVEEEVIKSYKIYQTGYYHTIDIVKVSNDKNT